MTYKYLTQLPKPKFMEMLEQDAIERGLQRGMQQGMQQGMQRGMQQGIQQGMEQMRRSKLEDARKLAEHGVSWETITSATGVKQEDLVAEA